MPETVSESRLSWTAPVESPPQFLPGDAKQATPLSASNNVSAAQRGTTQSPLVQQPADASPATKPSTDPFDPEAFNRLETAKK